MAVVRTIILLMLLASAGCFGYFAATGQQRFKRLGLLILKWTLFAAFGFFSVLIVERLM